MQNLYTQTNPMTATVYLLPAVLSNDDEALKAIPAYVTEAVKACTVFFAENEKTARRYFKKLRREMVIDNYAWHTIHKAEDDVKAVFITCLKEGKTVGIVSEAGCPGIADPGQILIDVAQQHKAIIKPLVGPSSVLLALMGSGLNGQNFAFHGYLPIDSLERKKKIKELETESLQKKCTQIFIETPYRNNALLADILQTCKALVKLCIASELTGANQKITTQTVGQWKAQPPQLHKIPVIFLLYAG